MLSIDAELNTELLTGMVGRLDHSAGILRTLGEGLLEFEDKAFATGGFGEWAPNDPVTAAFKGTGRVLVDTGTLLHELTSRAALTITSDSVAIGTDHVGAVMAARGARGAPVRNATPAPDSRTTDQWAGLLLDALMGEC